MPFSLPGSFQQVVARVNGDSGPVRVLSRGLAILRIFCPRNDWLSNHEIATAAQLPRPTVSRLVASLAQAGYLEYSRDRGQYRLGPAVLTLGYAALSSIDVFELARPLMQEFARREELLVVLSTRDAMSMVCHEVCHGGNMLTLRVGVGSRLSLCDSAVGRALIGALPEPAREALLSETRSHEPDRWSDLGPAFADAAEQMQRNQFYTSIGTLEQGVNGMGAMIDVPGVPNTYVLGVAAPAFRLEPEFMQSELGPRLYALKRAIESRLAVSRSPEAYDAAP